MHVGIQRRGICLVPPDGMDRFWIAQQFDRPEIWKMFGLEERGAFEFRQLRRSQKVIEGVVRRAADWRRIGFVVVLPPWEGSEYWEYAYAIPRTTDRDAYSAMHAMDATAHYLLDHLKLDAVLGRTREDNRAAQAILRRVGYEALEERAIDDVNYTFFRLDRTQWDRRRARIEGGERDHPSGLGAAFVTLAGPPYQAKKTESAE